VSPVTRRKRIPRPTAEVLAEAMQREAAGLKWYIEHVCVVTKRARNTITISDMPRAQELGNRTRYRLVFDPAKVRAWLDSQIVRHHEGAA
jgi:hypothetical protein